jgi:hypothetical protein
MKIAIMQPYFFPYVGYYNLLAEVDKFVIYDDIQFTKRGWINRNYLNSRTGPWLFSIPVTNVSTIENIGLKRIAPEFNRSKLISRIEQNYQKFAAPEKLAKVRTMISFSSDSLFEYLFFSLTEMSEEIGVNPDKIIRSSSLGSFANYKGQEKVIRICKSLNADEYMNPIGGKTLYDADSFEKSGILLRFQDPIYTVSRNQNQEVPHFSFLHDYLTVSTDELRKIFSK